MGTFPVNLPRKGADQVITFILKINFVVASKYFGKLRIGILLHSKYKLHCIFWCLKTAS